MASEQQTAAAHSLRGRWGRESQHHHHHHSGTKNQGEYHSSRSSSSWVQFDIGFERWWPPRLPTKRPLRPLRPSSAARCSSWFGSATRSNPPPPRAPPLLCRHKNNKKVLLATREQRNRPPSGRQHRVNRLNMNARCALKIGANPHYSLTQLLLVRKPATTHPVPNTTASAAAHM